MASKRKVKMRHFPQKNQVLILYYHRSTRLLIGFTAATWAMFPLIENPFQVSQDNNIHVSRLQRVSVLYLITKPFDFITSCIDLYNMYGELHFVSSFIYIYIIVITLL